LIEIDRRMLVGVVILLIIVPILVAPRSRVEIRQPPTPDRVATAVISALQSENEDLGTQIAQVDPGRRPLSLGSDSETIRRKMQLSPTSWRTIRARGIEINLAFEAETTTEIEEVIDQRERRFRVGSGPVDQRNDLLQVSDGTTLLLVNPLTGWVQSTPLPAVAFSPFDAGDTVGSGPKDHALNLVIHSSLNPLIFPVGLSQQGGFYQGLRLEESVGRLALVTRWIPGNALLDSRQLWIDAQTGIVLRMMTFEGIDESAPLEDIALTSLELDVPLPPSLFDLDAIEAEVARSAPTQTDGSPAPDLPTP
jgi:hypothetical protein